MRESGAVYRVDFVALPYKLLLSRASGVENLRDVSSAMTVSVGFSIDTLRLLRGWCCLNVARLAASAAASAATAAAATRAIAVRWTSAAAAGSCTASAPMASPSSHAGGCCAAAGSDCERGRSWRHPPGERDRMREASCSQSEPARGSGESDGRWACDGLTGGLSPSFSSTMSLSSGVRQRMGERRPGSDWRRSRRRGVAPLTSSTSFGRVGSAGPGGVSADDRRPACGRTSAGLGPSPPPTRAAIPTQAGRRSATGSPTSHGEHD